MKKKPDEYYEIMYNAAKCLVREAETSYKTSFSTVKKRTGAQGGPGSAPANGPDAVAKYRLVINSPAQGRSPDRKIEKKEKKP